VSWLLSPALLERTANDIRGPVGVLRYLVDEGAAGTLDPAVVDRGKRALQRLVHIAERLSRAAQLELGVDPPAPRQIDLSASVRRSLEAARLVEARSDVEVEFNAEPFGVFADDRGLEQALADLLTAVLRRARRRVQILLEQVGPRVLIHDDGVRSTQESDVFVDLPFVLASATLERQGFRLLVEDPIEEAGLHKGGRVVVVLG
jgi:hypothetical protein